MRRLFAAGLAAVALSACSGEQGQRAQQLLNRAEAAQTRLSSAAYEARLNVSFEAALQPRDERRRVPQGPPRFAGPVAPEFGELAEHLSDVRVALFVAQRSGLIRSAVISLGIEAEGKEAELQLTYRLDSVNRAIAGL